MYGQDEITPEDVAQATDNRGVIAKSMAARIRRMRAAEQWERYDAIVVGPGAADRSRGWFNTWADFANADQLAWFSGRDTAAGQSYVNQGSERTDWAQDLYQTHIEFLPPPGIADIEEDSNDGQITPTLFTELLPAQLSIRVVLSESDEIAKAPANHFPSGFGVTGSQLAAAAAPMVLPGSQGQPHVSNSWKWPEPVMLAAKAKITVFGLLDDPIRTLLRNLPGPGNKLVPIGGGVTQSMPNWYTIKITHRGPRYLQLRGARSSA